MIKMIESVNFGPQANDIGLKDFSVGCLQNV